MSKGRRLICNAEKAFYGKLESIGKDEWLMHSTRPHKVERDISEELESPEHRLLKALAVKIVVKERAIRWEQIPERILTEHALTGGIVADIFVIDSGEVVEVETLYSAGFHPIDKLDHETLRKYIGSGVERVRVVLLPLHFFMYLRSLAWLRKLYRERYGLDVEIYTVDVENERFISLSEAIELLKRLRKQIEEGAPARSRVDGEESPPSRAWAPSIE